MRGNTSAHDKKEDGQNIQNYAEPIDGEQVDDNPPTVMDSRNRICYLLLDDMRARIVYVTIFGCFVGLGIPLILYYADKPTGQGTIYGSCLIKDEFRYKCLINKFSEPSENECIEAKCCWENNETLSFKCYHSFNPAYQYHVISADSDSLDPGEVVEIRMEPNHKDRMSGLVAKLAWMNSEHLNIQIFDRDKFPDGLDGDTKSRVQTMEGDGDFSADDLDITFSNQIGDYFYIRIGRNETNETLFDTRIGPLISTRNDISFATVLPTKHFYGLKGGQGIGPTIYDVITGYDGMDLPFYIPMESSGKTHGILFETVAPFIVQYIDAPGIMFHFGGPQVGINMHFFSGPTVKDVSEQINSYLTKNEKEFQMPPYWALGLHLCQNLLPEEDALKELQALERGTLPQTPYDSHCIGQNIRTPFQVDLTKYNQTVIQNIIDYIESNYKRLLLTQKIGLQETEFENGVEESLFICRPNKTVLIGINDDVKVIYPNFHHNDSLEWLQHIFEQVNISLTKQASGLTLIDNFPLNENSIKSCPYSQGSGPRTRLEQKFLGAKGLVCPDALHFENDAMTDSKIHFEVNNEYGHKAILNFKQVFQHPTERVIITSSSVRPNSFPYSGFNGLTVPFTWSGMVDSLTYVLRNFMAFPYAGTPICGNYVPVNASRNDAELCLRWFQLGLLLPFARNTYGKTITRGPLDFNLNDQRNLINAIQERYRYNPYYYTLFHIYHSTRKPPIRPLVYDFHEEMPTAFNILTQFMIGPALMAAPMLSRATTTREAYFPRGTWYEVTGTFVHGDLNQGAFLTIPGLPSVTPLFIRGGHVIPTLTAPSAPTAELSRHGSYTILGTFPRSDTEDASEGILFVDDGVTINSKFDLVKFSVTNKSMTIISTNCEFVAGSISRTIDQIKLFGFPPPEPGVITTIPNQTWPKTIYSEVDQVLQIKNFNFDWCQYRNVTFTWIFDTKR